MRTRQTPDVSNDSSHCPRQESISLSPVVFAGLTYSMGRYEQSANFENGQRPTRKWIPGELKAEGLIGGKVVATHVVRTAGVPAQLALSVEEAGRHLVAD